MSDEKRMIENFEVMQVIRLGSREFILAEDKNSTQPYMTCECKWDNALGLEEYYNGVVSNDYLEIMTEFLGRATEKAKEITEERNKRGVSVAPLTTASCIKDGLKNNLEGQIIVIKAECLSPEYRTADRQLVLATGGNGCNPNGRGNAVFCTNLFTGKHSRFEKYDVAGIIHPYCIPEWTKQKIAELEKGQQKPSILNRIEENKKAISEQSTQKTEKKNKQQEL